MDAEIMEIIHSMRKREIGVEVAKNWLTFDIDIEKTLKKNLTDEIVDILEAVQCYLLEITVGSELIQEVLEKYKDI